MKKLIVLYGVLSGLHVSVDYAMQPQVREFVILRTARVLPKKQVDSIDVDLLYLQRYHDAVYDALCLSLIDPNKIVAVVDACLLESLYLIDENRHIKDVVEMVLEARLLDSNFHNPTPYQMPVINQEIEHGVLLDYVDADR